MKMIARLMLALVLWSSCMTTAERGDDGGKPDPGPTFIIGGFLVLGGLFALAVHASDDSSGRRKTTKRMPPRPGLATPGVADASTLEPPR